MAYKTTQVKGNPFTYISKLVEAGISNNVELKVGASSGQIIMHDKGRKLEFTEPWKPSTFSLKAATERELKALDLPETPEKIQYIGVKPPRESLNVYEDVISLDVKAAYHQAARRLGYFSQELYERHVQAGKMERLQAFGATAKRTDVFYLVDGELEHYETQEGPLRPFFLNSAAYIGRLFQDFAAEFEANFLFYWVDCIFLKNAKGLKEKAEKFFEDRGIFFHDEKTNFVIFETRKNTYHLQRGTPRGVKEYNFPRYEINRAQRGALIEQLKRREKCQT
jgi:hypothetical protein